MRRALAPALATALAGLSCARDLEMPSSSPPRIDSVQVVGLEASPPPVPLPVLGGELVAIRGGGFPADAAQLEVQMGGSDAQVLDLAADRIVARVPTVAGSGALDLTVRSPVGFRTQTGALRYDGSGQPLGLTTSDVPTSVSLGFVSPVMPPPISGFANLAVAIGAADSALVVVPSLGVAMTTIPLGLVPSSAAARVVDTGTAYRIDVLALARSGEPALGQAFLDHTTLALQGRVAAQPLATGVTTKACTGPQILFTASGRPVAAWMNATSTQKLAAIDDSALGSGQYQPTGTAVTVSAGAVTGWAPWGTDSVVFAAGGDLWVFDAAAPATPTQLLVPGTAVPVSSVLTGGCGAASPSYFYTVAAASSGGSTVLAASYRAGGADWVALVDLTPGGASVGTVSRGPAGTVPTSLALVPDPPYGSPPGWVVLVAGYGELYRFRPLAGAGACGGLVADAALPLSSTPGNLPIFGGMATTADGTRVLSVTPDGDLVTLLPPSLTSAGSVLRVASYGGLSLQQASIGGAAFPLVVAEHALTSSTLSALDTGSALLALSPGSDGGSVALGGSGYGRGALWFNPVAGGALAYTGDLPGPSGTASSSGGAASVTIFAPPVCADETVHIAGSRPVAGGPDLVTQGPARSGALGPDGVARWGPATPPVYAVRGTELEAYVPTTATVACLAGSATPDWTACPPDATIPLGVAPLDVVLATGDRAVAARTLETDLTACTQATGFPAPTSCNGDLLCLRASCPPARSILLSSPGAAAPTVVSLPTRPDAVAADRGGGFLVTLPCAGSATTGGAACFPSGAICPGFVTSAGGTNGALVLVAEDGSAVTCLAVLPGLNGPLAVTPNGAEAWVIGHSSGVQLLSRLSLPRRTDDGAIDPTRATVRTSLEALGAAAKATGAFPIGGVAFTPDGGTGIVTVPGEFRILLSQ